MKLSRFETKTKILDSCYAIDNANKSANDIYFSSKPKINKQQFYRFISTSNYGGLINPIYDSYDDIIEDRATEWYIKEIYGNEYQWYNHETDLLDKPSFYDYINSAPDKRKEYRTKLLLPLYQTKFIRKFIRIFAEVNGKNINKANSRETFYTFRYLFIKVFGSTRDFEAADHKTYTQVRKIIGSEARDYWYEEVEVLIPRLRYSLAHSLPIYPEKINDTYFDDKPFVGVTNYDRQKLEDRLKYWKQYGTFGQKEYIPDLYEF